MFNLNSACRYGAYGALATGAYTVVSSLNLLGPFGGNETINQLELGTSLFFGAIAGAAGGAFCFVAGGLLGNLGEKEQETAHKAHKVAQEKIA